MSSGTSLVKLRPEGKVPCLGLGPTSHQEMANANLDNITGICFQKVDNDDVKAGLHVDSFAAVRWAQLNRLELGQPQNVRPEWQEFSDAMGRVKTAMLQRMIPAEEGDQPEFLFDGFHSQEWRGAPESDIRLTHPDIMLGQIKTDIGAARANWNESIEDWIQTLCKGLYNPEDPFKAVLQYLLPNCQTQRQTLNRVVNDVSENDTLEHGAIKCLVYGYQEEQLHGRDRQRIEHKFLLPKRNSCKSRSRSCSPPNSDDDDEDGNELAMNVYNSQNPHRRRNIRTAELLSDPDRYFIKPEKLHLYVETHKSDLLLLEKQIVPNRDYPGYRAVELTVKVVIQMPAYERSRGDCAKYVRKNVDRCAQSCLAALGCTQELMYGLVVVVDGFVLIKVQRQSQRGGVEYEYEVSATDLIMWDDLNSLHALFYTLGSVL